jgi:hypothetical protein
VSDTNDAKNAIDGALAFGLPGATSRRVRGRRGQSKKVEFLDLAWPQIDQAAGLSLPPKNESLAEQVNSHRCAVCYPGGRKRRPSP